METFETTRGDISPEIDPLIQDALLTIREKDDFALIRMLINRGPLAFSDIMKTFEINPTELDRTLDRLMSGALINNFYAKRPDSKKHSFYEATGLAKALFEKLRELQRIRKMNFLGGNLFYTPGSEIASIQKELDSVIERLERMKGIPLNKQSIGGSSHETIKRHEI